MAVYISYLKLVTQTERMPASAAARQATGTTSEICFLILALQGSIKYNIEVFYFCEIKSFSLKKHF